MDHMCIEACRLWTFRTWPISEIVSPIDLAAAGFYYTKIFDRVRCVRCGVDIFNWQVGDDPIEEHKKWGGRCKFLEHKSDWNIPLNATAEEILEKEFSYDVLN